MSQIDNDINNIINETLKELNYLDPNNHKVKYCKNWMNSLRAQMNATYVYIKYKVSYHDKWEYIKFYEEDFLNYTHEDIEDIIFELPEWSWVHNDYHSYSITYQICTSDEYHNVNGF